MAYDDGSRSYPISCGPDYVPRRNSRARLLFDRTQFLIHLRSYSRPGLHPSARSAISRGLNKILDQLGGIGGAW